MFYEGMIDELSTLNDTNSAASDGFSEDDIGQRKNAEGLGVMDRDKNQVALNDDSDLDMDGDNDGNLVGDSGSDKGEAMWSGSRWINLKLWIPIDIENIIFKF